MGLKDYSKALSKLVTTKKLVFEWGESSTSRSNIVKTDDLRVDVHKDISHPDYAIAKIQVNKGAKDAGAKDFLKKGSHKTTHKNLAEIRFSQSEFDEAELKRQIADAWKAAAADDEEEGSGSESKKPPK